MRLSDARRERSWSALGVRRRLHLKKTVRESLALVRHSSLVLDTSDYSDVGVRDSILGGHFRLWNRFPVIELGNVGERLDDVASVRNINIDDEPCSVRILEVVDIRGRGNPRGQRGIDRHDEHRRDLDAQPSTFKRKRRRRRSARSGT